jgi:fluoroacetyl-CoA thioesterase
MSGTAGYGPGVPVETGLHGSAELRVGEDDTAVAMHSGDVAVLATPRLVALAEEATCRAVSGELEDGETTVGMRVQINHLAPTSVGTTVTAEATLDKIEGRRLTFTISVSDDAGLVGAGKVTRAIVDRDEFLDKAR